MLLKSRMYLYPSGTDEAMKLQGGAVKNTANS